MASDADSRKRSAYLISNDEVSKNISCSLCARQFDEAERTPRVLMCGHHFCTDCIGARIRQESARKWSIICPLDQEETQVPKGDAAKLGKCFSAISTLDLIKSSAAGPLPFRIFIKNLAGDTWPLVVRPDDTIAQLKRRVQDLHVNFVVHLQKLMHTSAGGECVVLEDACTLASHGIVESGAVVSVLVMDGFRGGAHVRTFGSYGNGAGQFSYPYGICVSPDGELLFVADSNNHRVQVVRASDGAHVRTIGAGVPSAGNTQFDFPTGLCLSANGESIFVADANNHRVQVLRASDGAHVRTIGSPGGGNGQFSSPRDVQPSLDGELLYISDSENNRVQVVRALDGAHVRTIGSTGSGPGEFRDPRHMCLSSDGALIFVADTYNNRVQIFRAVDGVHVRSIGSGGDGAGQLNRPLGVCVSPSGEWLFVANFGNDRVQVLRASDGEHMHTISSQGDGDGQFIAPSAVCLSPNGEFLFVADQRNHRVQVFTTGGQCT